MKKFLFYVLILSVLVLAACGETEDNSSEEEGVATGESTNEMSELEEENEELRRQLEEQDDEEGNDEASEEAEVATDNNESESSDDVENTEAGDDQKGNSEDNRSDLVFDINSSEVQAYINKNGNYDGERNFVQDAISIGMSQTEIEDLYGEYDYTIPAPTGVPVIYENIAILYDNLAPYGEGSDGSDSNINPNENKVEMILYFANLTEDELLNTLGSPDEQLSNLMGTQNYIYEGNNTSDEWETLIFTEEETPEGLKIGTLSAYDNVVDSDESSQTTVNEEDIPVTEEPDPNAEIKDEYDYEYLLTEYLQRLAAHYNMVEYDDVYYYIKRGSAAYDKIAENKASGHFTGHETIDVELIEMTDLGNGTVELNADRVYSHDNSEGQRIANVNYIVNAETHEVLDFEPVSDEAY